jgi:glutamate racemase
MLYPDRKVLSITIPGVEAVHDRHFHRITLLATKATIESDIYQSVAERMFPGHRMQFQGIIGTGLVDAIERGASDDSLRKILDPLLAQCHPDTEAILL